MAGKLPRITAGELLRALARDGWRTVRQSGSHVALKHDVKPGRVIVPKHAGVILKPKTLETILKRAGLTADEVRNLLIGWRLYERAPVHDRFAAGP
ncbi:MAG TPA: type II toxin-antitoxin system HicA family toxin [Ktedonobacterales bacterium]|nr:type II toxin-antitoxin system HicA family toxin [Ktedonobacterales bacterium]